MAKWKLCRQTYGNEVYEFTEGDEVTIGRGTQNTIILPSLNISRRHCVINVKEDEVIIEDLKSANGIFVGLKKIAPNTPVSLSNNDIIGLGWVDGAPLAQVNDAEKFVFKLVKTSNDSIIQRITFQNENELHIATPEIQSPSTIVPLSQGLKSASRLSLKRHSKTVTQSVGESNINGPNIQNVLHNCNEDFNNLSIKRFKDSFSYEIAQEEPIIKMENEDEQYEAFNIKQECFDDEVQVIDSDSDSEQWYIRLSQNSPKKSFSSFNETRKSEEYHQDSSYSQLDDDVIFVKTEIENKNESDEEAYEDDLFTTLPQPENNFVSKRKKSVDTSENINNECENLVPEETNELKKTMLNQLKNIFNDTSNDKNRYEINKNIENDLMPKLANTCFNSTEISREIKKSVITTQTTHVNYDIGIKNIETSNILNSSETSCFDAIKRDKGVECPRKCETEFKKPYETNQIQILDHKSQPSKKSRHNSKGKIKKKKYNKLSSKIQITNSQKEERKKKLREIATKDKCEGEQSCNFNLLKNEEATTTTSKVATKVTTSNRGAFLTDSKELITTSTNRKKVIQDNKDANSDTNSLKLNSNIKEQDIVKTKKSLANSEPKSQKTVLTDKAKSHENNKKKVCNKLQATDNKRRTLSVDSTPTPPVYVPNIATNRRYSDNSTKENNDKNHTVSANQVQSEKLMTKNKTEKPNTSVVQSKPIEIPSDKPRINATKIITDYFINSAHKGTSDKNKDQENLTVLKSCIKSILKPMNENKEPKRRNAKSVTFSDVHIQIREFEIEHGNQMKKTSSVKSSLLISHHMPVISLQKISLMKILRWNPQWLEEQTNFSEPPPILGHNNVPMAILHSFSNHTQYVELIGDLLLMEIWECLTQGYIKTRNENKYFEMRIDCLPLVPPQRRGLELINLNVNVSVPTVQAHTIPREGEIMMIHFGEEGKICRFFFVQYVKCLPSPQNNINSFYTISLQTSFTEKMRTLQRGAVMYGKSLAYINKDLKLFEAMEYLSTSPLSEVILNPQPRHFLLDEADRCCNLESRWSQSLNDSQRRAVTCAVSAARGERPRIHMIQGPPGTGKSRVICAIVMEYFYDAIGKKRNNRGKILVCATSNAAVDELVIRLLDIRQSLPQPERLKVVRVGRVEAMHPRARDISSLKLAQRDVARLQPELTQQPAAVTAEISLLEAKKNMWQTKAMSTDDDARKAYCQNRVAEISKKIALIRSGGGGAGAACGAEQLAQTERRVLEGADVVLTTLASAHSHKMRGLAGRIALCVVDEAGQAIEPETLVPLTLGVTRLALVGDHQQLPGFICSQRAKQHGLGESLFARLSSCAEMWKEGGPILLDQQYRMHPHIADYPNRAFYGGRMQNAATQPTPLDSAPYFVLGIVSGDHGQDASGANDAEAWGAARVALALRSRMRTAQPVAPPVAHSVAVITPYAAQRELIRRHLRTLLQAEGCAGGGAEEEGEVEVNTVDSFQGQERSVVVVSLARSHGLGFLTTAGRMNVMLTRAKHALVLCLNPKALEKNHQWRSLVEDAQKRNLYNTLPLQMCRAPAVQQVSHEEMLQYLSGGPPQGISRDPRRTSRRQQRNKHYKRRRQFM